MDITSQYGYTLLNVVKQKQEKLPFMVRGRESKFLLPSTGKEYYYNILNVHCQYISKLIDRFSN